MRSNTLRILAVALTIGATAACTQVPAGHVGVKVYLLGTDKGVDHEVLGVGRYWVGVNEELYLFPTFEQNPRYAAEQKDDAGDAVEFQNQDGLTISADFSVTYTIAAANASQVFQRYRLGIDEINRGPLRNILRDAVNEVSSKLPVEAIYGNGKTAMMTDIENLVIKRAAEAGITVTQVSLLGAMRLPDQVTAALNTKITATQKAQQRENELREAEAAARIYEASATGKANALLAEAKAQAEANKILANSLSPALVEYERVKKWDGKLPTVSGATNTFMNLPTAEDRK